MDKVKEGNASKEELAKEREIINEMRKKAEKEAGVKLFVGGLPHASTEDELRAIVESHGEVRKVDIAKDNEGNSRGFGFVVFADADEGRAAIKALNGIELGDGSSALRNLTLAADAAEEEEVAVTAATVVEEMGKNATKQAMDEGCNIHPYDGEGQLGRD